MLGLLGKIENSYENRSYGLLEKTLQELLNLTYEDFTDTPANVYYLKALGYLLGMLERRLKDDKEVSGELMNLIEKAMDHIAELVFDLNVYYDEELWNEVHKIATGTHTEIEKTSVDDLRTWLNEKSKKEPEKSS